MKKQESALRQAIVEACRELNASGLNQGTSGNISARLGGRLLVTPSGVPCDELAPEMIASMPLEGAYGAWEGPCKPSSEWRFHLDLARARPEFGAIVHAHAPFATALAIARKPIPPVHYMIAAFGGPEIRCAAYATFGTEALSRAVLAAMQDRNGCLMANHGMLAAGPTLARAMWLAAELETLARQYLTALGAGGPVLLSEAEVAEAERAFAGYGPRETPPRPARRARGGPPRSAR